MIAPNPRAPMVAAGGFVAAVVAAGLGFWAGQGPAPTPEFGATGTRPTEVGAPLLVQAGSLPAAAPVPGDPQLVAVKVSKPAPKKKKATTKKASTAQPSTARSTAAAPVVRAPAPVVRAPAPAAKAPAKSTAPKSSSGSGSSGTGSGSGGDSGSGSGAGGSE